MAKRWAVAIVGIPAVLGLLYLGGWWLAVPVALFAALGALEIYRLAERSGIAPLGPLGAVLAAALVLLAAWRPTFAEFAPFGLALLGGGATLALAGTMAWRWPGGRPLGAVAVTLFGSIYTGLSLAVVPLMHALPETRAWTDVSSGAWGGLVLVALPLAATWLGDALALFAGTAWGRGGLAPTISPRKSWVGVWAGLFGAGVAGVAWLLIARTVLPGIPIEAPATAAGVGIVLGIFAIVGDLAESLLKREAGVKDSGTFFPGHGGVLDRLDALVFTLPAAYATFVALD